MKKLGLLCLLATFILAGCGTTDIGTNTTSTLSETRNWLSLNNDSNIINCSLSLYNMITSKPDSNWSYNQITTENAKQESPLQLTFVWLNTNNPVMKWNIDTVPLTKIDNWATIYLLEKNGAGDIALYTYFPKEKIMIMGKQYNLVGNLLWLQMMWFCE